MIVPMKKAAVIIQEKDSDSALKISRRLGVLHLEPQRIPKSKEINEIQNDIVLVDTVLLILSETEFKSRIEQPVIEDLPDWQAVSNHIIELKKRLEHLEQFSIDLKNTLSQWDNWGDFDTEKIHELAKKNIFIRFYRIPQKELKKLPDNVSVKTIFNIDGIVNCLVVSREKRDIGFKEINLPVCGPEKMRLRIKEDNKVMESIEREIKKYEPYFNAFTRVKKNLIKGLEFHQALSGMAQEGRLAYLAGYVPYDKVNMLTDTAKREKWGLFITEPSEDDNVPVLLRNPKWVSLITPLFKLLEVVPGYHELDVSPLFLIFLSLFFGMIIGDAGYGTVYFLLTFLSMRKFGGKVNPVRNSVPQCGISNGVKDKTVFYLFFLFSSCAIIWGLSTGTVFGQQWYLIKGFKPLLPILNETKFLMAFCFFLGAFQLSLAHCWQAIIKLPSLKALADAGFICLLWSGFFLAKMFILGDSFPVFGKGLVWAGILLVIFFTNPQKNMFRGILEGVGVIALGLMGNFGDVVSYIRLFAVGLAGVAVADAVNTLAAGFGGNIIARIIILAIGHTINIVLGPISVLVHGIRLNILEFSLLHGNVTWSGLAYRPLKN